MIDSQTTNFKKLFSIALLLLLQSACTDEDIHLRDRGKFLIAPMIEGINMCQKAINTGISTAPAAIHYCYEHDYYNTELLSHLLDSFEPQGPQGKVIIGYTYGVSLLGLYTKTESGKWQIEQKKIKRIISQITKIDRPVILYLMSNHFDTANDLAIELAKNKINLMYFQGGEISNNQYFETQIIPFTINSAPSIPVNKYRYTALKEIASHLIKMPQQHFSKIKAITLNGEVHHIFHNFRGGPGFNSKYRITDYSDTSIYNFRDWLKNKFHSISKFNKSIGFNYSSFEKVFPPSKDMNKDMNIAKHRHIDNFSNGFIPIHGWLWGKENIVTDILIAIDNHIVGTAERNFNRLDVYQVLNEVDTPNVGFSYQLNYSDFSKGSYTLAIVGKDTKGRYFKMGSKEINISQGIGEPFPANIKSNFQRICEMTNKDSTCIRLEDKDLSSLNVKFWVDSLGYNKDYIYNKLSYLWLEFRQYQVSSYMDNFTKIAINSGLPENLLYSHQILSGANSDWNYDILSAQESITGEHPYNIGVNLYGGSQYTQSFKNLLTDKSTKIGVPEYHPQRHKNKQESLKSVVDLYDMGVDFIVPYFVTLIPRQMRNESSEHNKFIIRKDNSRYGSSYFHQAIIDISKK